MTMMTKWKYKQAQDEYRLEAGDIWQAEGGHTLVVGDIQRGDHLKVASAFGPVKLLYSDPPWGRNLTVKFREQASASGDADYEGVLLGVCEVAKLCGTGFIEMNVRDAHILQRLMEQSGAVGVRRWSITYPGKRRCVLLGAGWGAPIDFSTVPDPTGLDDTFKGSPTWALTHFTKPGDVVMDPCLGLGTTVMAAVHTGRRCIGTELNPTKLAEVVRWLDNRGFKPQKVGQL